jgi:hypothetical protein
MFFIKLTVDFSITRDNASANITMMSQFCDYYRENFNKKFIGEIPCAAHIINLIVNDIMSSLKLNAARNDEIAQYINEVEEVARKEALNAGAIDDAGKIFFIQNILL